MQERDAVLMTLPGTADADVRALESRLEGVAGIEAAISGLIRGRPAADGAVIVLKIKPEALGATAELARVLEKAFDAVRGEDVTTATFTLSNATVVAVTGSMAQQDVERALRTAVASEFDYEVAVSFADEEREYVSQVVDALHRRDVRVFYDADHSVKLWGENLVDALGDVYGARSRYVVIFVSQAYVRKQWTRHELQHALARAITEKRAYVLPARFDDSIVPGLPSTIRHVDCRQVRPTELADMICKKLGS